VVEVIYGMGHSSQSHDIYYFYHYFCISLLWSLYCLFITLHKEMNVPWHILLLPLFLSVFTLVIVLSFYNPSQSDECHMTYILLLPLFVSVFTLVIVLSFYNPSQSDECPMTYITSTTISACLYFWQYNDQSKDIQK
jgi:peptidoglycan/LPS O-acetylase OafA/YrhL